MVAQMKQIISKIDVQSFMDSSGNWKIAKYDDGSFSCNCPAWIFHRGSKVDCKHILEFKRQSQEQTLTIQGIDAKNEKDIKNGAHNSVIDKNSDTGNDITLVKIGELLNEAK